MFSIYTDQNVKQQQWVDLDRQAAHNQIVREALAAQATQQANLVSATKRGLFKLTHNVLSGFAALGMYPGNVSQSR